MKCPYCQFDNPPAMHFCGMCGNPIDDQQEKEPITSADSSTDYTPTFLKQTVLAPAQAVRGERKHVTVFFVDIVGFTTIAEQMDPEDVYAIINDCFFIFTEQIHRAVGTVNQYTGDGVMALFGAPVAYGDHIRAACRAALGIMPPFQQYAKTVMVEYGVALNIRIGIHTGPVVVGVIGNEWRRDYTAIGDTTNVAARLQTTAQPGTILVSDKVRQGADKHYVFEDAGRFELKGKSNSVRASELKAAKVSDPSGGDASSIFVNRRKELDRLNQIFNTVVAGNCRIMAVIGEAGMGKRVLVERFIADLPSRSVMVLRGQGKPYARMSALLTVLNLLQRIIDKIDDDKIGDGLDGPDKARTPRADKLQALIDQFENLGAGHLHSTVFGKSRQQVLYRAIRDLLADAAKSGPVMIFIENIQWVDAASIHLINDVRNRLRRLSIILVYTGRYELADELPCPADSVIVLPPFNRSESRRLLCLALGTDRLANHLQDELVDKAGGNPLFISEIATALRQSDVLQCGQDRCKIKGSVAELATPESLQAVMTARLDALPPDHKQLVQLSAVIGDAFTSNLMIELVAWPVERLSAVLQDLNRMGILIFRTGDDMPKYRFRQVMMREVAYESLLHKDLKYWHQKIAAVSERLAGRHAGRKAGFLSFHFQQAANWPKAFNYTLEAALAAEQSHSCHDVLGNLKRAFQILDKGRFEQAELMVLDLYLWQGRMQFALGQLAAAQVTFEKMAGEALGLKEVSGQAEAVFRLGWIAFYRHQPEQSMVLLEQAMTLSRQEGLEEIVLKASGFLGYVKAVLGRLTEAQPLLDESFRMAQIHGTLRARAWSLCHMLRYCSWTGNFNRALELGGELEQLNRKIVSPYFLLMHGLVMGQVLGSLGRLDAARQSLKSGLKQLEDSDDQFWRSRYLNTMGWIAALQGKLTTARRLNRQSAELALKAGDMESYYNARINLGENYLDGGQIQKARQVLTNCRQKVSHEHAPYARWRYKTRLLINLARLYEKMDQRIKGLRYARQALSMARQSDAKVQQIRALLVKSRLLADSRKTLIRKVLLEALKISQQIHARSLQNRVKEQLSQMK